MRMMSLSFSQTLFVAAMLCVITACSKIPPEAHYARGQPESLLDVSSEVVNFSIVESHSVDELAQWINQDQPTRAELYCPADNLLCAQSQDVLDLYGVPTFYIPSPEPSVALVYERILARGCENRYIDNTANPYNLNHPTFGCSVAVNMLQMVSDKQQFVNPNLMDYQDAKKALQSYRNYLVPTQSADLQNQGVSESLVGESDSQ